MDEMLLMKKLEEKAMQINQNHHEFEDVVLLNVTDVKNRTVLLLISFQLLT